MFILIIKTSTSFWLLSKLMSLAAWWKRHLGVHATVNVQLGSVPLLGQVSSQEYHTLLSPLSHFGALQTLHVLQNTANNYVGKLNIADGYMAPCLSTCSPQVRKIKHARFLPLTLLGRGKKMNWWNMTIMGHFDISSQTFTLLPRLCVRRILSVLTVTSRGLSSTAVLLCDPSAKSSPSIYWPSLWKLLPRSLRLCYFCCCYTITPH